MIEFYQPKDHAFKKLKPLPFITASFQNRQQEEFQKAYLNALLENINKPAVPLIPPETKINDTQNDQIQRQLLENLSKGQNEIDFGLLVR